MRSGKDSVDFLRIGRLGPAQDDVPEPHFEDFEFEFFRELKREFVGEDFMVEFFKSDHLCIDSFGQFVSNETLSFFLLLNFEFGLVLESLFFSCVVEVHDKVLDELLVLLLLF